MNFITPAYAQAAAGGGGADMIMQFAPLLLVVVIFYFLMLRPQQKRQQTHLEMIKNVRRGDTITTSGGLVGKISRTIDDNEVEVEIAPNIKVRLLRQGIADVRSKGEPVKE